VDKRGICIILKSWLASPKFSLGKVSRKRRKDDKFAIGKCIELRGTHIAKSQTKHISLISLYYSFGISMVKRTVSGWMDRKIENA